MIASTVAPRAESAGPPLTLDPAKRPERPDQRLTRSIRFLTEDEYPPFNFAGAGGDLEGFNVDLARAICTELEVPCTIQARRWDTLETALLAGGGDAVIAGLAPTTRSRQRLSFSLPYLRMPARFVIRADRDTRDPAALAGRRVGAVEGSAHAAWLGRAFPEHALVSFKSANEARAALKAGDIDAVFGDGLALAFWLNGSDSEACCRFLGGAYHDSRAFGEGFAIAMRPADDDLKRAIDYALFRLQERGLYADIFRRWFPIDPFAP